MALDGRNLGDRDSVERGMADEVPPYPQRDVLNVRIGEPRLLEDRTPSTRVVDLVAWACPKGSKRGGVCQCGGARAQRG